MRRVKPGERVRVSCQVNGKVQRASPNRAPCWPTFSVMNCGLYGTHVGCEHGVCGACTVVLDGRLARSCSTLAVQAEGAEITTVEGLAADGRLDFDSEGRFLPARCIAMWVLHARYPRFSESFFWPPVQTPASQKYDMLSGHICRCTGYGMIRAILEFASGRAGASE